MSQGRELVATKESITDVAVRECKCRPVPPGTLLLSFKLSVGKVGVVGREMFTNEAIAALRFRQAAQVDTGYMYYALRALDLSGAGERAVKGVTLNLTSLAALKVPVPPLAEQRRIAAVLDKADGIRRKRRESSRLSDEFLRSAFLEMFGDPVGNQKGWPTFKLSELIESGPQNGLYLPASDYGSGTPIVRINSFYDGEITDLQTLRRVRATAEDTLKYGLQVGDVLINRVNSRDFLGKSALVPGLHETTVFESNMMRFRVRVELVDPGYLVALLQTPYFKRQVANRTRDAVNQASINQDDLQSFDVRIPPIALQQEYVALQSQWNRARGSFTAAEAVTSSLFDSLAQRAFQGEL
jgi:type I restriction enzyme S subunit